MYDPVVAIFRATEVNRCVSVCVRGGRGGRFDRDEVNLVHGYRESEVGD